MKNIHILLTTNASRLKESISGSGYITLSKKALNIGSDE